MDPSSYQRSPFLSDIGVPDPSSSSSTYADFNSPVAPGSPNPNLNQSSLNRSVPATPYTPSFAGANAGSYTNSPFGSDISYVPGNEFQSPNQSVFPGGDYADFSAIDIDVFPPEDYDPSNYDAPGDNSSLLFSGDFMASLTDLPKPHSPSSPSLSTSSLNSNAGVSVSVMPAPDNEPSGLYGSPFDHGSPSSSNGDLDQRQHQNAARSRGSSVSSMHGPGDFNNASTLGLEHVRIETNSPIPSWNRGAQSPPQLSIPRGMPEIRHTSTSPVPSPTFPQNRLFADNGGGTLLPSGGIGANKNLMAPDGPGIQIVPATPVSGGTGVSAAQGGPFGHTVSGQTASSPSAPSAQIQSWAQRSPHLQSSTLSNHSQTTPSPYTFPASGALTPPPTGGVVGNENQHGTHQFGLGVGSGGSVDDGSNMEVNDGDFLIPIGQNPRIRSKSDTSLPPPIWQLGLGGVGTAQQSQGQNQGQGNAFGSNVPDFEQQLPQLPRLNAPHASFGPPITGSVNPAYDVSVNTSNVSTPSGYFLSPEYGLGGGLGGANLRRVRSEHGHQRNALSADMRPIFADDGNALGMNQQFISRGATPFLSPNLEEGAAGGNLNGGMMSGSGVGAHRRTLSHGSHGHSRSLSRERLSHSPYPSPHASPRANVKDLFQDSYSFPDPGSTVTNTNHSSGQIPVHVMSVDAQGRATVQTQAPIQVPRQQVTTIATADASQRRRRTEASFTCPVPGCGSTFTRHFNLKGHLRSHNEERPFKCKWPGCDKGFARQHDCKRHENLHQNIRPYNCQGCQRTFARMDALNRHLRSDAGAECLTKQPILSSGNNQDNDLEQSDLLPFKSESNDAWQPSGAAGSVMV